MDFISYHIMPLVVNSLEGGHTYTHTQTHTHTHTHTHTSNTHTQTTHKHIQTCILTSQTKAFIRNKMCAWFKTSLDQLYV